MPNSEDVIPEFGASERFGSEVQSRGLLSPMRAASDGPPLFGDKSATLKGLGLYTI